jgi:hypothetical protein
MPPDPRLAELRAAYFARVRPVLGEGLSRVAVSVEGAALPLLARTLELLAGCCLGRIVVRGPAAPAGWPMPLLFSAPGGPALLARRRPADARRSSTAALRRYLRFKNPFAPPVLAGRGPAALHLDGALLPARSAPSIRWSASAHSATLLLPEGDLLAHQDLSYALARDARDALLGRCAFPDGPRFVGDASWPFALSASPPAEAPPLTPTTDLEARHLLVVGCGSVGSEVVRLLASSGARLSLVDGGRVSIFNPHRQWFGAREVGELKVRALARRLAGGARALPFAVEAATLPGLESLLERDPPDAVLLATGTAASALLAPLLWRRRIPHLAACAYPRARFFELALVCPAERTPCLACLRGHLERGPEAALPIDDELGRFLYQELSAEDRERRWQELVAEPATPIETGRIADLATRCLLELVRPDRERADWFRRVVAEGTSCLLGGNLCEHGEDGAPAYGIVAPGQVVRLGLPDLYARDARGRCEVCGRAFRREVRGAAPEAEAGDLESALLQPTSASPAT